MKYKRERKSKNEPKHLGTYDLLFKPNIAIGEYDIIELDYRIILICITDNREKKLSQTQKNIWVPTYISI